jgi:hypothetical protein
MLSAMTGRKSEVWDKLPEGRLPGEHAMQLNRKDMSQVRTGILG